MPSLVGGAKVNHSFHNIDLTSGILNSGWSRSLEAFRWYRAAPARGTFHTRLATSIASFAYGKARKGPAMDRHFSSNKYMPSQSSENACVNEGSGRHIKTWVDRVRSGPVNTWPGRCRGWDPSFFFRASSTWQYVRRAPSLAFDSISRTAILSSVIQ